MPRLEVRNLGPIREASVSLADLTILVGPQASGKSIFLQTLKLAIDHASITHRLRLEGLEWRGDPSAWLDLYFGEGMRTMWSTTTVVQWQKGSKRSIDPTTLARSRVRVFPPSSVFYVPAHRALTLKNGWPRHFGDYSPGDPFVVREFSEILRNLLEFSGRWDSVFMKKQPLTKATRDLVQQGIFGDYAIRLDTGSLQKRLVLQRGEQPPLPFMVWSAGQREFSPMLIGLDYFMPQDEDRRPRGPEWVILEEPEMGLHPKAITTVLLLVLELLRRGYRICLSTHSPHILDLVWALRVFREKGASPAHVLKLFDMKKNAQSKQLASDILQRSVHVYYFDRQLDEVVDISRLDPSSDQAPETSWGGLIEWSTRVSDTVADLVANS